MFAVALRKESVDRNNFGRLHYNITVMVALRKESVDRNFLFGLLLNYKEVSLSARRAWIETLDSTHRRELFRVALRKESVDRNA